MTKIIKNSFGNFLVVLLIFSIVTGWIFSGWPQIWKKPSIPPEIQEARAENETLWVDGFDDVRTGWTRVGNLPYLNSQNQPTDYVWLDRRFVEEIGDFSFTNSSGFDTINSVDLYVYGYKEATLDTLDIYLWNGATWTPYSFTLTASYGWENFNVSAVLDTWAKIDGAKIYLAGNTNIPGGKADIYVDAAYLYVDYSPIVAYPTFDTGQEPHEDPEVHNGTGEGGTAGNPVNVGSNVTFKATATDAQTDNWTLLVCKTDGVTGIACDDGAGDTWCTSSSTTSAEEAYCTYTALVGDTESNAWYAYACDASVCSPNSNSGTSGNNGTPFYVNHGASFTVVTDLDDPSIPGGTVTITTEADDLEGAEDDDTLSLYVCKTASATASGCGGGEWCNDTSSKTSDPTCNWTMNVAKTGDLTANQCEGSYSYWPYIFDNHGFAATSAGGKQGVEDTNTVSNVDPEVTAVSLNTGSNFQLSTEQSSDNIVVTGTVKDDNGCVDVDEATTADTSIYYYKSAVTGYAECDDDPGAEDDNNYCYSVRDCAYDTASCTGTTDSDSTFTCTVAIQYHANPTDGADSGDSTWWDYTWRATLIGSDGVGSDTMESTDIEMLSFMSYDLNTANIEYDGPWDPGATSANQTTEVEATGNVGLDVNLYSTNANMCTVAFPACENDTMVISAQHWGATDDTWDNMTALTTTSSDELELNCLKTIETGTPAVKNVHWKIKIPDTQAVGSYFGQNTIAGKKGEAGDW